MILLQVVTAVAAYKVCKQRIDTVELALKEALADVGTEAPRAPAVAVDRGAPATTRAAVPSRLEADDLGSEDDDVPF